MARWHEENREEEAGFVNSDALFLRTFLFFSASRLPSRASRLRARLRSVDFQDVQIPPQRRENFFAE
jgi:hypothetical protein